MMNTGLVAAPPDPISPDGEKVTTDGWYPDLDVNDFAKVMHVPTIVTNERRLAALISGYTSVYTDLAPWQAAQMRRGVAELKDVPCAVINQEPMVVSQWRRAVYNHALAELTETHRAIGSTNADTLRTEQLMLETDELRRVAVHAIRDILGKTRTMVVAI